MSNELGYLKGEKCNRDNCEGIIEEHEGEGGCCCHINPPCSYCTTSRDYCPVCDWDGREEQRGKESEIKESFQSCATGSIYNSKDANIYESRVLDMMSGKLPRPVTLEYISETHTHFSMIKKGVFPESMSFAALMNKINGTFGGRFSYINKETGAFSYIAYTD